MNFIDAKLQDLRKLVGIDSSGINPNDVTGIIPERDSNIIQKEVMLNRLIKNC